MASAADTWRASRYHNQSGVNVRTVDFGGVGGIAALDPALPQVPTVMFRLMEILCLLSVSVLPFVC